MDILERMKEFTTVSKLADISLSYLNGLKEGNDEDKNFYDIIFANILDEAESNWMDVIALIKNDKSFNLTDFVYKNYIDSFYENICQIIDDFSNEKNYSRVQDFIREVQKMVKILDIMYNCIQCGHCHSHAISPLTSMARWELRNYIDDFLVDYMKLCGINFKPNT